MLLLIANDAPLGPKWFDHPLGGDWTGHRECHIGGDFLLAYKLDDGAKHSLVVFVRAGMHSDLFEQQAVRQGACARSTQAFHL